LLPTRPDPDQVHLPFERLRAGSSAAGRGLGAPVTIFEPIRNQAGFGEVCEHGLGRQSASAAHPRRILHDYDVGARQRALRARHDRRLVALDVDLEDQHRLARGRQTLEGRVEIGHRHEARAEAEIAEHGMAPPVGTLVAVESDRAAACAYGARADDHIVGRVERQVAIDQPSVERIRLERSDRRDRRVLGGVNRVPANVGPDVDDAAARGVREIVRHQLRQYRLVAAVLRQMPAEQVAIMDVERQPRLVRADAERWPPRHQSGGQKSERAEWTEMRIMRAARRSNRWGDERSRTDLG
jgi:hypothetical protein